MATDDLLPEGKKLVQRAQDLVRHNPEFSTAVEEVRQRFGVIPRPYATDAKPNSSHPRYFSPFSNPGMKGVTLDEASGELRTEWDEGDYKWYLAMLNLVDRFFQREAFGYERNALHPAHLFLSASVMFTEINAAQAMTLIQNGIVQYAPHLYWQWDIEMESTQLHMRYLEEKLRALGVDPEAEREKDRITMLYRQVLEALEQHNDNPSDSRVLWGMHNVFDETRTPSGADSWSAAIQYVRRALVERGADPDKVPMTERILGVIPEVVQRECVSGRRLFLEILPSTTQDDILAIWNKAIAPRQQEMKEARAQAGIEVPKGQKTPDPANEERDASLYRRAMDANLSWAQITRWCKEELGEHLTERGIQKAVERYCDRHPELPRPPERPRGPRPT